MVNALFTIKNKDYVDKIGGVTDFFVHNGYDVSVRQSKYDENIFTMKVTNSVQSSRDRDRSTVQHVAPEDQAILEKAKTQTGE